MRLVFRAALLGTLCALGLAFAPPPTYAAPPLGAPEPYTVQAGDTLFAIATRFHTTVAILKQLNGIGNSDTIQVGQKLLVPTSADTAANLIAATAYTVQPGDTLYRIALEYGTPLHTLEQLNGITNPNLIAPGQALAIPSNPNTVKPGLSVDPPAAHQGGTVMIQVTRPEATSVTGTFNGKPLSFTRAAGYFYALAGISRCAKIGNAPLAITSTNGDSQTATETATISIAATAFPVQKIDLPPSKGGLLDNALLNREAAQLATIISKPTPARMWTGVWRMPLTGPISSAFGTRRSYNGGAVGACGHEGTDFDVDAGVPLYAPARGQVVFAGLTQVRGNMTVIDHGAGVFSAYYHQSAIVATAGQIVEPGELIGKVGTTGLSTGPHLHWSVFVNGEYVDPLEWTRRMLY